MTKIFLCLSMFSAYPHVKIATARSSVDALDRKMEELGHKRKVAMSISSFSMALPILSCTNFLFTSLLELTQPLLEVHQLTQRSLPFEMKEISFGLVWSSHLDKDPAKDWFQNIVTAAVQDLL